MSLFHRINRKLSRVGGQLLFGKKQRNTLQQVIDANQERFAVFSAACEFIRFEAVEGDIFEFGVYTGMSLAMLQTAHQGNAVPELPRRIVGFDSFQGLAEDVDRHPNWQAGDCALNHSWHPLTPVGAPVTPQVTRDLFAACKLPAPELIVGVYDDTLPDVVGKRFTQVALVHIDCDLYEAARTVLFTIESCLQDGTVLLFDDWFHYKADPNKGEARAFREFLEAFPHWQAVPYRAYATFCNSFILHRREG
jgi:O-methyltransferase